MNKRKIISGLILAVILAVFISPYASQLPDGLEKAAKDMGFLEKKKSSPLPLSPLSRYTWPGVGNRKISLSSSAALGTLVVFGLAYGVAALVKKRRI